MDASRRGALDVTFRNVAVRHPLKVVSGALLLFVSVFVFLLTRDDVPPPERIVLPLDAGPPVEPVVEVLAKIEEKPVTTKKGKLLKDQMKKRLEAKGGKVGAGTTGSGGGGSSTRVATGGSVDIALAGDAELRRAVQRKLRSGVRVVDESAGTGRWLASLSMTTGEAKGVIFAKCSAAMSELPQRKLVGSLANRADVSGDGANDDELKAAAKQSCADSLADDVASWVRARR